MNLSCPGVFSQSLTVDGWQPRCDVAWLEIPQSGFLGLVDITYSEANQIVFAYATVLVGVWVWRKLRIVASF